MMASEDVIHPSSDSFWEVDCYKRTVKRQDDGHKMCTDLMQLINDRGHIEKEYAKALRAWSKKWTDLIDKGSEYGTSQAACKAVMQEAEGVADLHLEVRERLVNDVHNAIKTWRTENYHKSMVGPCKETKELDDGFKKAQKPWAKRYSKVMKARKDYHSAVKQEKTATNQENNSKNDSAVSADALKKIQERVEKCRRDVESTKSKYEEALNDINSYNAKYMEDMTEVFNKCQAQEEKRLKFFKEMLFGIHKCLDLSVNPAFGNIYVTLKDEIATADSTRDLKYWSEYHGVDMAMNWPTFEDYSEQLTEISKKKLNDVDRSTVTLRKIRYHEDFAEYAPEPHTISRKEKKSNANSEAITLTSVKQNDTPTHVPVSQQGYSNYSADDATPPPSASSQISQNRPAPKPVQKQESYDPSLNPFTDDADDSDSEIAPMPSRSHSKGSSRLSVNSQSEAASHKSQSSIDTNPFADDMDEDGDDDVLMSPKSVDTEFSACSVKINDEKAAPRLTVEIDNSCPAANNLADSKSDTDLSGSSTQLGSPSYATAPATPEKPVHRKKGLAPRAPLKSSSEYSGSARRYYSSNRRLPWDSSYKHWDGSTSRTYHQSIPRMSTYDAGLNPFGDDEDDGKDQQQSKRSSTNNGSAALEEWADNSAGSGMEEVMRVPVRALYDYTGQEEDELSFKSGDVFIKLKDEDDQGWCVGEKEGQVGLFPKDYVDTI